MVMNMRMLKVAFIDDGINASDISYKSGHEFFHYIVKGDSVIESNDKIVNSESHGTLCASVFVKYAPDCNIYDINISPNEKDSINVRNVNIALQWCVGNDIHLISMSLGILSMIDTSELKNIIDTINLKGIILVASCSNTNKVTYPASLDNVLGVRYASQYSLKNGEYYFFNSAFDGIDIATSLPVDHPLQYLENQSIKMTNSFAVPYIASKVCHYLMRGMDMGEIRSELMKNSKYIDRREYYEFLKGIVPKSFKALANDIPVLGVVVDMKMDNPIQHNLKEFFKKEGYLCALLDDKNDISKIKFSREWEKQYNISTDELISLIVNSNIIDVLLVVITVEEFEKYFEKKLFDIYLVPQRLSMPRDSKIIDYTATYDVKVIFSKIIKMFDW
jgi:hypothetical protein